MFDYISLFERARRIAVEAHGEQRYGDEPYEHHLAAVVAVLQRFGANHDDAESAALLVAAWLHDALEDTALARNNVEREFGGEIAELVWRVTDEPGQNRKARKAATLPKIAESESAIILKLADRIANVEAAEQNNSGLFEMYRREHAEFAAALQAQSKSERSKRMWRHLSRLLSAAAGDR